MKKSIFLLALFIGCLSISGQEKKPTIMVVPSDVWCFQNGFVRNFENQGVTESVSDYQSALKQNSDLLLTISKINTLMVDRGFPLKNLESVVKLIASQNAEDNLIQSKTSGASLMENPIDRLRRTAKADIIMQLTWTVNIIGPKRSITYNLQGIDSYTDKQIAGTSGTGPQSFSTEIPVLLEEAVIANMDGFCNQLQMYFDDLQDHGREVSLDIRVFDNGSGLDLESEFGDLELTEIIDAWVSDNTVDHIFNKTDASETYIKYEQIRIPLYNEKGLAMDTEGFARELSKYLRKNYEITCKVMPRGLGRCILVLGEK